MADRGADRDRWVIHKRHGLWLVIAPGGRDVIWMRTFQDVLAWAQPEREWVGDER